MTGPSVLITGYTAQQVGNGTRLGYGPVISLFAEALRDAGCAVDHRRSDPEMDISGYDCAIIGQAPINALNSSYLFGALDVIRRARSNGVGLLFAVDDWQLNLVKAGINTYCNLKERLAREAMRSARKDMDWAMANLDELYPVILAMRDRPWPATLIPKFEWGNAQSLLDQIPSRRHVTIDPSAYAIDYPTTIPPDSGRYGAWVLGILSDQREWVESLGLSWPVSYVGGKKSRAEKPLKEAELIQRYAECWGILSPPYKKLFGTGWWRNRFVYAARTGAVLYADPQEAGVIGDAYQLKPKDIEVLSVPQLRELADTQRQQLFDWQWSKERVQQTLLDEVNLAIKEARE